MAGMQRWDSYYRINIDVEIISNILHTINTNFDDSKSSIDENKVTLSRD